jgi:putative membrane-bound dehydrogenase-like protein
MKPRPLTSLLVLFLAGFATADVAPPPPVNTTDLNGQAFSLPSGFTIESAAAPPLTTWPITMASDEEGRLYVAESSGSLEKPDIQLQKKPHRIVRLEDTDGDGKFDKRIVFADGMMFPEGTMWMDGSLYVAAPPSIWKLTDTNNDGVADQRVEWYKGETLTGCANDLHGPYRGPDGWIYWTKGAFAKQTHDRPGKKPLVTRASHVFRARPDGSGREAVMTGGMDNPVDLVFTETGEMILSNTFLQHPGGGKRDGLLHVVYGGVYGKEHDPLYEHPWTGPDLLPIMTHHGPSASCGLVCTESDAWGKDFKGNLFACLFNLHRVTRHVLVPKGSTFTTKDEDFLISNCADFHPTDIIEDADGSLLVADTGGWYKLCCPTSQLVKPAVLGGIYRIKRTDAKPIADPRGLKIKWDKLTPDDVAIYHTDSRHVVRRRAGDWLINAKLDGEKFIHAIMLAGKDEEFSEYAPDTMWTIVRHGSEEARGELIWQMVARYPSSRLIALHDVSLWRGKGALAELKQRLAIGSPIERRRAAEALGRYGGSEAVKPLLEALLKADDRFLEHAIIYALIEIGDGKALAAALGNTNPGIRRGAMIALDQLPLAGHLKVDATLDAGPVVEALTSSTDVRLREAAGWIIGRHPEWGGRVAEGLGKRLADAGKLTAGERDELAKQLAKLAASSEIQSLLVKASPTDSAFLETTRVAWRAMALSRLKQVPASWTASLTAGLSDAAMPSRGETIATIRALPWGKERPAPLIAALLKMADSDIDADTRLAAFAAIPGGVQVITHTRLAFLLAQLDRDQPGSRRAAAADILVRASLTTDHLTAITARLDLVAATEINQILDAFTQSTDAKLGLALAAALKKSPAFTALRADQVIARLTKYGPEAQREAAAMAALLNADLAGQRERLEKLLATLGPGDVNRGHVVFRSARAACSTCHATGYVGGTIGPDLTRIGAIRAERDLLESILFPSISFVQGYEPWIVTTKEGEVHTGRLTKNTADEVVLISATREIRLPREQVEDVRPGKVSIMPTGLEQQLSQQELADLVAFLKASR